LGPIRGFVWFSVILFGRLAKRQPIVLKHNIWGFVQNLRLLVLMMPMISMNFIDTKHRIRCFHIVVQPKYSILSSPNNKICVNQFWSLYDYCVPTHNSLKSHSFNQIMFNFSFDCDCAHQTNRFLKFISISSYIKITQLSSLISDLFWLHFSYQTLITLIKNLFEWSKILQILTIWCLI